MTIVRSHKGKIVDVSSILAQNSKVIAAGNMKVNARGDLLGQGGKIIKTKEQLAVEYFDKNPKAVQHVVSSLNTPTEQMLQGITNPQDKEPVTFLNSSSVGSLDDLDLDPTEDEFEVKVPTKVKKK